MGNMDRAMPAKIKVMLPPIESHMLFQEGIVNMGSDTTFDTLGNK